VRPIFLILLVLSVGVFCLAAWKASTQPQELVHQKVRLHEGQHVEYPLEGGADIQVRVTAAPKQVHVVLRERSSIEDSSRLPRAPLDGDFKFITTLTSRHILRMDRTSSVPPGHYSLVVERPHESLIFEDPTEVEITVIRH
jgi:hypothetical protein